MGDGKTGRDGESKQKINTQDFLKQILKATQSRCTNKKKRKITFQTKQKM